MKQLKRCGESMQTCLTPLTTLNSSDAPLVVLTWHHCWCNDVDKMTGHLVVPQDSNEGIPVH